MGKYVLERQVFHAGKTFIFAGESHANAYIIQDGEVASFVTENHDKVEVSRFGPGTIIAETNLLLDQPSTLNFEALVDTTVVTIIRQDFEKKLTKLDKTLLHIIKTMMNKLKSLEEEKTGKALDEKRVDEQALEIVAHLLRDMSKDRKKKYKDVLLPHFNVMVRAINDLRDKERMEKQKEALDKRVSELKGDEDTPNDSDAAEADTGPDEAGEEY